jgi:hypothetical protein
MVVENVVNGFAGLLASLSSSQFAQRGDRRGEVSSEFAD